MIQGQQLNLSHSQQAQQPLIQSNFRSAVNNQSDKIFCSDLLSTEKYVSGAYDINILNLLIL